MTFPSEWLIYNVNIVLEERIAQGAVYAKDGTIAAIIEGNSAYEDIPQTAQRIDGGGQWLLPGFIDVHIHGGAGGDFMDASQESYEAITRYHASQGTTGMLATTMTASKEAIDSVLQAVSRFQAEDMPYAALYGVHLEGPFLCLKWIGAQNSGFSVSASDRLARRLGASLSWTRQTRDACTGERRRDGSNPLAGRPWNRCRMRSYGRIL